MTEHPDHNCPPPRVRTIAHLHLNDGTLVDIEHVFAPEGAIACDDCGKPVQDPGFVGLMVSDDEATCGTLLTPEEALLIGNRLIRGANLVLESGEDVPDIEREAARYTETAGQERGAA